MVSSVQNGGRSGDRSVGMRATDRTKLHRVNSRTFFSLSLVARRTCSAEGESHSGAFVNEIPSRRDPPNGIRIARQRKMQRALNIYRDTSRKQRERAQSTKRNYPTARSPICIRRGFPPRINQDFERRKERGIIL